MFVLFDLKTYASNDRAHRHCSHVVTVVVNFIKRQGYLFPPKNFICMPTYNFLS